MLVKIALKSYSYFSTLFSSFFLRLHHACLFFIYTKFFSFYVLLNLYIYQHLFITANIITFYDLMAQ